MTMKQLVPWWAKIGAKLILSRLRVDYGWWQKSGLFVHGAMDRPEYAYSVVMEHLQRGGLTSLSGKVVLELGPGDSLASAVIARALGARTCYLVDAGAFAKAGLDTYVSLQRLLEAKGLTPPDLQGCKTLDDVVAQCHAVYITTGVAGLRELPSGSVDFVFSQAVLEHVRLSVFAETQRELRRVLRPDGVAAHVVDLKDHLKNGLNNLRMSEKVWEAEWMASSGFYTNRLRFSEVIDLIAAAGFSTEVSNVRRWDQLPTPRRVMAPRFQSMDEHELEVSQFDVVARPVPDA